MTSNEIHTCACGGAVTIEQTLFREGIITTIQCSACSAHQTRREDSFLRLAKRVEREAAIEEWNLCVRDNIKAAYR